MLRIRYFITVTSCAVLLAFSSGLMAAPKDIKKPAQAHSELPVSAPATPAAKLDVKADPEIGQQINGVCAGCHGPVGEGGKKGEYPRLAGQKIEYLKAQLMKFKMRQRVNMPMFPYTEEREMPDEDVVHISDYLAKIKLDTVPPVFKENEDALARLTAMSKVFNIPRVEGNVDTGSKTFKQECAVCHGSKGMGKKEIPMLAGQYTQYLKREIDKFVTGARTHNEDLKSREEDMLTQLKPEEIQDILAYLSTINE